MDARTDIRDLIDRARRGSPDAVGRIFEAVRGQLLELADRELPEDLRVKIGPSDVVQETALDMQRDFGEFNGTTPEECFAWLRQVLQHNVVDAIRRYRDAQKRELAREQRLHGLRSRARPPLGDPARPPEGSAIRREEAAAINAVLTRLPPDYRRVLELRYWGGLSFVAMAPELGRSPEAVRKLWYRALERLQGELATGGSSSD
jgi:RNA polymerase sigma-70 factor (ECF subfamily)